MTTAAFQSLVQHLDNQGVTFDPRPERNAVVARFKCDLGIDEVLAARTPTCCSSTRQRRSSSRRAPVP